MVQPQHASFLTKANPGVQEFYNSNPGIDYIPAAEHIVHAQFDGKNVDENTKRHISQVHRIRKGSFRQENEFIYFYEEWTGHDHRNNELNKFVVNGKYEKPVGSYIYDELTGNNVCTGIARFDTIFTIPFDVKILDDMVEKEEIDGATTYYVQTVGGREYAGFEYEDFRAMSFEDLVHLGKTGFHPEEKAVEIKAREKKVGSKE